jgi:hypothetical protein
MTTTLRKLQTERRSFVGDLAWNRNGLFILPFKALRHHVVCLGASGSGKTETLFRTAYGACKIYRQQVIYLDLKGESKRGEEREDDNAARFVAAMRAAGAQRIAVFPATHYNGWQGTARELHNRLLSVLDFSESPFYGDVEKLHVYMEMYSIKICYTSPISSYMNSDASMSVPKSKRVMATISLALSRKPRSALTRFWSLS